MNLNYDFLIVGAGPFGSVCARKLTDAGYSCLVVDKRSHIAGNCHTNEKDGIHIHTYGPHIFHTSNEDVWSYVNKFADFNNFVLTPIANYKGELYPLPFNMWTFNALWGVNTPVEAKKVIASQSSEITDEPSNLEEQAIKTVGRDVYNTLIKGYTAKQWMKDPKELPASIIKRLPVRFTYDNNYFNDKYQGIPIGGYTKLFEKMLDGVEVRLGVDYLKGKDYYDLIAKNVIYTGPIDEYFGYKYGELEYKTTRFEHKRLNQDNHQGCAVMNYTDQEVPYTRTIEHKHFDWVDNGVTWITKEYPTKYKAGKTEPYYPVNDQENNDKYSKYLELANSLENVYFGGRLAEYKYYDMDDVIESALNKVKSIIDEQKDDMS
jgi:UDP-galactopyranose mutase